MLELIVSVLTGNFAFKGFQKKRRKETFFFLFFLFFVFVFPSFLIRLCAVFRHRPDGVAAHLGKADAAKL
jgi:hypothetical protein